MVIDSDDRRAEIIHELYDLTGHRGRESTYARIAARYYWNDCWTDVKDYVGSCKECQHRSRTRLEEAMFPTRASRLFTKLGIDVVHMPNSEGFSRLVVIRDDFSG